MNFAGTATVEYSILSKSFPAKIRPASYAPITVTFDPPVLRFGCRIDGDGHTGERQPQLRAYDEEGQLAICDFGQGGSFAAVQFDGGRLISEIQLGGLYLLGCDYLRSDGFDDFVFEYPPCGDPGIVAVQDGDLELLTFSLAAGQQYKLDFPGTREHLWFDRAKTQQVIPQQVYTARDKGDMNDDGLLDGLDCSGFVSALVDGPFDPLADFTNDGLLTLADVPLFVEALLEGHTSKGVVAYIEALDYSTALGDARVDLLTDNGSGFEVTQSQPVTLLEFTALPTGGGLGSLASFAFRPAICPLVFTASTSAEWEGDMLVTSGEPPRLRISYSAEQVHNVSASEAILIVGDGHLQEQPAEAALIKATGVLPGRVEFLLSEGRFVKTPVFDFISSSVTQFRFNELQFDETDPGGIQPWYGPSMDEMRILHVVDPNAAQLDTYWYYLTALEVRLEENEFNPPYLPTSMVVKLVSFDSLGAQLDSTDEIAVEIAPFDDDPNHHTYRSSVDRPVIVIDTSVNKNDFPDLHILQALDNGVVTIFQIR